MPIRSPLVLALALVALATSTDRLVAQPSTPSASESAVLALDSLWARNYARHDTASAVKLMADDFFMTSANGTTKDRATELADIRPTAGLKMDYFRTEGVRVRVYGSAAVVTGVAAWAFEMNGRPSSVRRRYTATYVQGGPLGWKLVALHIGRAE